MKDPHNTVERLTQALESVATQVGAHTRAHDIYIALCPLNPSDFPSSDDQDLFTRIISSSSNGAKQSQAQYEALFADVWALYWRMSSNRQFN